MFGGLGKEEYTMLGSGVLDGKISAPFLHKFQRQAVHRMSIVENRRTCTDQGKYRITWDTVKEESCIQSWWITDFVLAVHGKVYLTSSSQLKKKKKKGREIGLAEIDEKRFWWHLMVLEGDGVVRYGVRHRYWNICVSLHIIPYSVYGNFRKTAFLLHRMLTGGFLGVLSSGSLNPL